MKQVLIPFRYLNELIFGKRVDGVKPIVPANRLTDRLRQPEVPTFIYMVRHGETILTPDRKFSGVGGSNPPLTPIGWEQAAKVATEIAKIKPDVLITSPMQRTLDTAEAIAHATGLDPIKDEAWYECRFGDWDGLSVDEVKEKWPDEYTSWISSSADRKSTRLNSSHVSESRMPSSA